MSQNVAAEVIQKFGGIRKAAAAIGAPKSTVQSWRESGKIPRWRRTEVIAAADRLNIKLPEAFLTQRAA